MTVDESVAKLEEGARLRRLLRATRRPPMAPPRCASDGAAVKDEDENGDDDGEGSPFVEARGEEEAEVAEDERAGTDVVTTILPDEPN